MVFSGNVVHTQRIYTAFNVKGHCQGVITRSRGQEVKFNVTTNHKGQSQNETDCTLHVSYITSSPWAMKLSWQHTYISIFYDDL